MKWRIAVIVVPLSVSIVLAQGEGLTDAEVDAAISLAKQQRYQSLFVEAHGHFAADFSVLLQGPVGRTMDLAREAFDSYKPLTTSDVPPEARAHEITLTVLTHSGTHAGLKNVVVMPPGATSRDAAIQPLPAHRRFPANGVPWRDMRPRTWKPGLGSEPSGFPVFYRFAEDSLPAGDLQIVVVTNSGEERYAVKAQERDRIR